MGFYGLRPSPIVGPAIALDFARTGVTTEYATWCLSGDFDASCISITFDGDSGDVVGGLAWQPTHQGAKVLLACGARKQGAALDLFGGLEEYMFMS